VFRLLAMADLFAFPSLYEGIGVSLLQAMAAGLACVAVDRPPMNGVVTSGETGLLVPPQDPTALAAAIVELATDPEERERLGAAAKTTTLDQYRSDDVARRLEALYVRVLGLR
jgi:starch synthase